MRFQSSASTAAAPNRSLSTDPPRPPERALTAIDLATFECSDAIDIALRVRAATLTGMYEALQMTPHRAGNLERLRLLIDSRNEPWSAAERLSHRLLRAARITGWETNLPVDIDGQVYYLDIAFRRHKLVID